MKDKTKFEELKKELFEKELAFEEAKGEKAALQKQAFTILKRMNAQLWKLRKALDTLEPLGPEIKALENELASLKTDLKKEQETKLGEEIEKKEQLKREEEEAHSPRCRASPTSLRWRANTQRMPDATRQTTPSSGSRRAGPSP